MKHLLAAALILSAPLAVLAQATAPAASAKAPAAKKATAEQKAPLRRSARKAVEEVTPIDKDTTIALSPEDLEVAKRVYVGNINCELGASVMITPNAQKPGFFTVSTKGSRFNMHPVGSRTGAIRLEDPRAGAMWLQLGNKSMLMSQKLGQRLADECASPEQVAFADDLKKNPRASILDAPAKP